MQAGLPTRGAVSLLPGGKALEGVGGGDSEQRAGLSLDHEWLRLWGLPPRVWKRPLRQPADPQPAGVGHLK